MADPYAILLVPTEAGAVLLARRWLARWGVDGTLPGEAWYDALGWSAPWDPYDTDGPLALWPKTRGLALWWDGALVPEGWWRAWCAWTAGVSRPAPCPMRPDCAEVLELAKELEAGGLCRVVLLDLVDGALVERAP